MLPSDTPLSGHALALLASSFRPVTADHNVPGFAWNCGLCVMPGTRKESTPKGGGLGISPKGMIYYTGAKILLISNVLIRV